MQNCKLSIDGLTGTFSRDEYDAMLLTLNKAHAIAKTKTLTSVIQNLIHRLQTPISQNEIDDEIDVYFSHEEIGNLIAILACYVPA